VYNKTIVLSFSAILKSSDVYGVVSPLPADTKDVRQIFCENILVRQNLCLNDPHFSMDFFQQQKTRFAKMQLSLQNLAEQH
jgi:hypothetical protein